MVEKLIIEIDDDKIKYAVFNADENFDYTIVNKKTSLNAGVKKGKILKTWTNVKVKDHAKEVLEALKNITK